jgi:hypothetical protein
MNRKSLVAIAISMLAMFTAAIAAPSAADLMHQALSKAQADQKGVLLHIGAPR